MINVKKGTLHSLQQSDVRGAYPATTVTSGQICYISPAGVVTLGIPTSAGTTRTADTTGVVGFAVQNSTDGDAVESNTMSLYTLDGNSIIETDQVVSTTAITAANFPIGSAVYADDTNIGMVASTGTSTQAPLGWVEGIRNLQAPLTVAQAAQGYNSVNDIGTITAKTYAFNAQVNIPVLGIKLASGNPTFTA
jgi:hypothetical protein